MISNQDCRNHQQFYPGYYPVLYLCPLLRLQRVNNRDEVWNPVYTHCTSVSKGRGSGQALLLWQTSLRERFWSPSTTSAVSSRCTHNKRHISKLTSWKSYSKEVSWSLTPSFQGTQSDILKRGKCIILRAVFFLIMFQSYSQITSHTSN